LRIRSIKPEFWSSLTIANLKPTEALTFIGIWNYVDDEGRGVLDPRLIKASIWPLSDYMTPNRVRACLDALTAAGLITPYDVHERAYFVVNGWREHQSIPKPRTSKFPEPPSTPTGTLPDSYRLEGNREQGTGKGTGIALSAQQLMFGAVCTGMDYDMESLAKTDEAEIGKVASALLAVKLEPDDFPAYLGWLKGPESPVVGGTRLTLHTLPRWVKDWRAKPNVVAKPSGNARSVANILTLADRMEEPR
jgi:hypothetical protein